jgi:hypothetical protein
LLLLEEEAAEALLGELEVCWEELESLSLSFSKRRLLTRTGIRAAERRREERRGRQERWYVRRE